VDKRELTAGIRSEALSLGFSATGVARAQPFDGELFQEWLGRGYQGQMTYMERDTERRLDPARVLPEARSVISVALLYRRSDQPAPGGNCRGQISRYAQGTDYHLVLEKKLNTLVASIGRLRPGCCTRICVDTGPVLEKAWAVRAGIGWQGKNTNILNRRLGSWFFLGEILTDVELEYDEPVRDYCGSCHKCIDACPTGALVPYLLDSRRCISYLTIELRADVPEEHREATGSWIFGCDICQDVCPWNRKSPLSCEPEFQPDARSSETDLVALAGMTPEGFAERYRQTAIKRTKRRGLMRNVAVALGNTRDPEVVPALEHLLNSDDAMVRRHAAWALARIGGGVTIVLLERRRVIERDEETREVLEKLLTPTIRD
jgi:epoxyqueuosine reductase